MIVKLQVVAVITANVQITIQSQLNYVDAEAEPYTKEQAAAVKRLIKYIRKYCSNAHTVIRHFDVNGKHCPAPMMNEKYGRNLKRQLANK